MRARIDGMDSDQDMRVDRRTFLKRGAVAGGAIVGAGLGIKALAEASGDQTTKPSPSPDRTAHRPAPARPNILVIVVDQLRFPQWFGAGAIGASLPPNLQRLRQGAVSFARHYTASNDCSPARSTMLTGLHTHQTGCMITGGSTLDPGFPTWGTMLREHGYQTRWLGKWHVTHGDGHWTPPIGEAALERYGFAGGMFPSPDGGPGQGWHKDPMVARHFTEWFGEEGGAEPWCTTVSFVNPHDIAWWYVWSDRVPAEASARRSVARLPPNYETPEDLIRRGKPRLQRSLQDTAAASFGPIPFTGPESELIWLSFLDLYTKLQREVDRHIGNVLQALHSRPDVAANTVIVFTSDHGEYGASHGLRGKGAGAYEEATRVPLIVKDPRGKLTAAPQAVRTQLSSSVDLAPLLLTIGSGGNAWRSEAHYAHLADRLDLAAILADPSAQGREFVLHATDETVTEFAVEEYAAGAPLHVVALRTPSAKYATYSHWPEEGIVPLSEGQEAELYDYGTASGRLELHSSAGESQLEPEMRELMHRALSEELRGPLPARLQGAHGRGFADYFSSARTAAAKAASRRRERVEQSIGDLTLGQGGPPPRDRPGLTPSERRKRRAQPR
jgi:arylsulfatase A-like enzyme